MTWSLRAAALLIDLDGTLVDSHDAIVRAWCRWAERRGVDPAVIWPIMPGRTADAVMRQVRPDLPEAMLAGDQAELLEWQVADTDGVAALPGARGVLETLPADRWAIVTSGSSPLAYARLRAAGLPIPSVLIGCDTLTTSKPDPAGYLAAAARLGIPPARCLVIEDSAAGIEAGRAAGMRVLAVAPAAPDSAFLHLPGLDRLRLEGRDHDGSLVLTAARLAPTWTGRPRGLGAYGIGCLWDWAPTWSESRLVRRRWPVSPCDPWHVAGKRGPTPTLDQKEAPNEHTGYQA